MQNNESNDHSTQHRRLIDNRTKSRITRYVSSPVEEERRGYQSLGEGDSNRQQQHTADTGEESHSPRTRSHVDWNQIKWLMSLARAEVPLIVAGSMALLIGSGSNLVIPQFIGQLMDSAISHSKDFRQLLVITGVLFAIVVVTGIFTGIRAFLFQLAGERTVARLRKRLFESIITQEIAYFDVTKTGELLNRLSSDTVRSHFSDFL